MFIQKINSLIVAEHITNLLMHSYANDEALNKVDECFFIECYENGREQGHQIFGLPNGKSICWSENRNSDDIVVYYGRHTPQSITDEAYESGKYFKYSDFEFVVKYIIRCIKDSLK